MISCPAEEGGTTSEWLSRVSKALDARHSKGEMTLAFSGGTFNDFLVNADLPRHFRCSFIIRGEMVEKAIKATKIDSRNLESLLNDVAEKFDCVIIATKGSALEVYGRGDAVKYMSSTKSKFCLIASPQHQLTKED
jgi:hypothetical protein